MVYCANCNFVSTGADASGCSPANGLCASQTSYTAESTPVETDRSSKARGKSAQRLRRPVFTCRKGRNGSQLP